MSSDISSLISSSGGLNNISNNSPILTSANATVNGAVEKVIGDFTTAQNQGTEASFLNRGYQQLITAMGFDSNVVNQLNNQNGTSNPVINAGVAGASEVFMNIVTKKLDKSNFGPLKSLNTLQRLIQNPTATIYENLPKSLTKMHWFVVAMETLLRKNNLPNVNTFGKTNPAVIVDTKSYAQALTVQHEPKRKFLFLMNIKFKGDFSTVFGKSFTYQIKKADRPKIKIEHEIMNMYNFRTPVPKLVTYDPITIEMYDASDAFTLNFFLTYMKILSPVMRSIFTGAIQNGGQAVGQTTMDASGMNFDAGYFADINQNQPTGNPWGGSLNTPALFSVFPENPDEEFSIIDEITIYHVYNFGKTSDVYHYVNPRITDFTLDDLDMAGNTTNTLTFNFMYDALNLEVGRNPLDSDVLNGLDASVPDNIKKLNFQGAAEVTPITPIPKAGILQSSIQQQINASKPVEPPLPNTNPPIPTVPTVASAGATPIPAAPDAIDNEVTTLTAQYPPATSHVTFSRDPVTGNILRVDDRPGTTPANKVSLRIPGRSSDPLGPVTNI